MKSKTKLTLSTLLVCLIAGNVGFAEDKEYTGLTRVNETVNYDNITVSGGPVYFDQYKKRKVDVNAENNFTISNTPVYVKTGDVNVGNTLTINKGANLYVSEGSIDAGTMDISGYFSMDPSDAVESNKRVIDAKVINLKKDSSFYAKKIGEVKADIINHGGSTFTTNKITAGTITMGITGEGAYPSISANEVTVNNLNLNKGSFFLGKRGETNAVLNVQNGYDNTGIGMQVYGTMNIGENGRFDFNSDIEKHDDPAHISKLNIKESATVNVNNEIMELGDVEMQNSKINVAEKNEKFTIENLTGQNGTFNVNSTDNIVNINKNSSSGLTVNGNSDVTNSFDTNSIDASMQELADVLQIETGSKVINVTSAEGDILGEITAVTDEDGKIVSSSIKQGKNLKNTGITELANVAFMAWRAENDEMHQRMGELRSSNGEAGIWARMKRGESKYGDMDIKNQYSTYQLGYDEKVGDSNWYIGGAISRTEGKSSFAAGSGENQSTGFTVYGTYVADDGQYVDLSAKYARLDNEFDVFGRSGIESTGDYRNNGYAFSAEYGKRIEAGNDFWVEPQVQLTYGHLSSANYTTSRDVRVTQDAMDSVVGRLGFAAGKDIGAGNVYVKASYLYDFDGDTSVTMSKGDQSQTFEQDLGGGWFEVGIGTNINLSKTSHLYFDVEKTYGGDIETPWQWNAGVRFDF